MTIQYCSDIHLEFPENAAYLKANPIIPAAEILILAGDVTLFNFIHRQKDFFDFVSDHFRETYWIPRNHEYYGSDISNRCELYNYFAVFIYWCFAVFKPRATSAH